MFALPFPYRADLIEQGGASAREDQVPCAIWPASSRSVERAGEHYTHDAQAPRADAADLQVANRSLVLDGVAYKIIEALPHEFLPHVVLQLRATP